MGNSVRVRVTPFIFPFVLENLYLPSPDTVVWMTVGAYVLKSWPGTDATM